MEAARRGIQVETLPVNTAAELSDAALALTGRRLDAVVQVIDNLTSAGFPTIARVAAQARLPVFACQGSAARQGASLALSRDYYDAGRETAHKAARVMRGESPAAIPFSPPATVRKHVNLEAARRSGLGIPTALLVGAGSGETLDAPHARRSRAPHADESARWRAWSGGWTRG